MRHSGKAAKSLGLVKVVTICLLQGLTLVAVDVGIAVGQMAAESTVEHFARASAQERRSAAVEPVPIVNGDFELAGPTNPPPGWAMWGAQKDKIPEHFARDTKEFHGGRASLRIYHPKDSRAYLVTDPQHAIRPLPGKTYRVKFWAKADRQRSARFGITAYRSIRPFVDAPSPGASSIAVGPGWQQYEFVFHEGLDFFAEESQYLLLTFLATTNLAEEATLWIDDIVVTMEPTREPRVLNPATLSYQPLKHRLKPGPALRVQLHALRTLGSTTREVTGISFHRVAGWTGQPFDREGKYRLAPEQEKAIRELQLPMTRFYAVGDEPFPVEEALDRIAEVCRRTGIPEQWTVIELEDQSAARKIPPDTWARAVQYSKRRGYQFRFWEVANEPYSGMWGKGGAFASAEDYMEHFRAVSRAIRKVDPQAQVGVAIHPRNVRWGNLVLKQTAGDYDFVVGHYYAFPQIFRSTFEEVVLTENMRTLDHILRMNALIAAYNPGRQVYQLDTEWGLHAGGPNGERADDVDRNANIWGVLHRAIRMIYYAREGMLRGASGWQMLSRSAGQGFAILFSDVPEARSMLYWLYYHFNRHLGLELLDFEGQAPFHRPAREEDAALAAPLTPLLATRDPSTGTIFLVVANASWTRSVPFSLEILGFVPAKASAIVLSDDNLDAKPLLPPENNFVRSFPLRLSGKELRGELPAHSVVFIRLEGKPAGR
jgi:hypothetical protein